MLHGGNNVTAQWILNHVQGLGSGHLLESTSYTHQPTDSIHLENPANY